jgi:site-specific DNA-methyltransferase (adenine-specific)
MNEIDVQCMDGMQYMATVPNGSVDLVLTDPPYIISRESGMDAHYRACEAADASNTNTKTPEEWTAYKAANALADDTGRANYIRYGSIYGRKYCVVTNYGEWDRAFTMEALDAFVEQFYAKLRNGGTAIIFFDLWKIGELKAIMEKHKFKQIRMIEWIKDNPQPLNSRVNYLTNSREVALTGTKKSKPVFNSEYDNGIYRFPIQGGRYRFHPTQKSQRLFEALIRKHTNEGAIVLDPFLGGGTTALAARATGRRCRACDVSPEFVAQVQAILQTAT